jgi:hypothetical protein
LPTNFSFTATKKSFPDDTWRSLAGFSRKVTEAAPPAPSCSSKQSKYCERCMYRGCVDGTKSSGVGVSYFEFRWSYFMNDATFFTPSLWPTQDQANSFSKVYSALPMDVPVGSIQTADWFDAADLVIGLCRSATSCTDYTLPPTLFTGASLLPGCTTGYVALDDDPDCASPTCAM